MSGTKRLSVDAKISLMAAVTRQVPQTDSNALATE